MKEKFESMTPDEINEKFQEEFNKELKEKGVVYGNELYDILAKALEPDKEIKKEYVYVVKSYDEEHEEILIGIFDTKEEAQKVREETCGKYGGWITKIRKNTILLEKGWKFVNNKTYFERV